MNTKALNMIFKLKEWDEEREKEKFAELISKRYRIEIQLREINERFDFLSKTEQEEQKFLSSLRLNRIYSEIEYLTQKRADLLQILNELDKEIEAQRQVYEEAYKERKKIEQLCDKIKISIKTEREKMEEKALTDILITRYGVLP